jgi:tRNA-Thr(GGU) m(6)t(6)A37 methyltransferase TsaA
MTPKKQTIQPCTIHPVGYVNSSDQEGKFEIQILPQYKDALIQLDQFSHVIIFWWADRHDNDTDRQLLTTQLPYAAGVRAGVFACRSEYRPNPIAMTIMPVLDIDQVTGVVTLPWIDALDGSPVVDLKPYIPPSDRVRDVKVADWMKDWPEWMEEAGAYFAEHQTDFGD